MANIKPIIDFGKVAVKYVKENPHKIAAAAPIIIKEYSKFKEFREGKKVNKTDKNLPYRKKQFSIYNNDILPNLNTFSYVQLISYRKEVEDFINQIAQEETDELVINKPIHSKRIKSWKKIFVQIDDKIRNRNYEELLKSYNSTSFESNYFDGKVINDMRGIDDKSELHRFIYRYTERNMKDIERDFS